MVRREAAVYLVNSSSGIPVNRNADGEFPVVKYPGHVHL